MMRCFSPDGGGGLADGGEAALDQALWIDLLGPDEAERESLGRHFGMSLPSLEEQSEIEQSSRLYLEDGVPVMTVLLPAQSDAGTPEAGPVSFILAPGRLVTLRHHRPRPFESFPVRAARGTLGCATPQAILIEAIVDRLADLTEIAGSRIEALARPLFATGGGARGDQRATLREIGRIDSLVMTLRESLLTVERMLGFLRAQKAAGETQAWQGALKSALRDVHTISEQAGFLQQKTAFLLDATLGLIGIEQNAIIKIFSVVAVVFLPPTLVASIYGMNFAHMPELGWRLGYPWALGLMILSALVPLAYFRRKGWF